MNILVKLSLLSLSVSVLTSCNPQEKFYDKSQITSAFSESGVLVRDVVESGSGGSNTCSQITSEEACKQAADCQGLYEELAAGGVKYLVCVANPDPAGGTSGASAGGADAGGASAGGADAGGADAGGASAGGADAGGAGAAGAGAGGASAGGASSGGYSVDDHDDDDHDDDDHNGKGKPVKPSSPVIPKSCEQIGSEHKVLVGQNLKVKICHKAANGKVISIAVACPAVAAHQSHHDDSLGLCEDGE
jgi:hypothetical protein